MNNTDRIVAEFRLQKFLDKVEKDFLPEIIEKCIINGPNLSFEEELHVKIKNSINSYFSSIKDIRYLLTWFNVDEDNKIKNSYEHSFHFMFKDHSDSMAIQILDKIIGDLINIHFSNLNKDYAEPKSFKGFIQSKNGGKIVETFLSLMDSKKIGENI